MNEAPDQQIKMGLALALRQNEHWPMAFCKKHQNVRLYLFTALNANLKTFAALTDTFGPKQSSNELPACILTSSLPHKQHYKAAFSKSFKQHDNAHSDKVTVSNEQQQQQKS